MPVKLYYKIDCYYVLQHPKREDLFVGAQQSPDIKSPLNYFWTRIQDKRVLSFKLSKDKVQDYVDSLDLSTNFTRMGVKIKFEIPVLICIERKETITCLDEQVDSAKFELDTKALLKASAQAGTYNFLLEPGEDIYE